MHFGKFRSSSLELRSLDGHWDTGEHSIGCRFSSNLSNAWRIG